MDIPKLVTIAEAAELSRQLNLGLSKNYIRTLVKTDQIKYHKVGAKFLIVVSSLMDFIENPPERCTPAVTGIRPVSERLVG
jgi:excisionase family DNA binding protein